MQLEENQEEGAAAEAAVPAAEAAPAADAAPADPAGDPMGLDAMDEDDAITTEYFKLEVGDNVRCIYVGPATFTNKKSEAIPAVKLKLKDESFAICASKILVDDLTNLEPGTPVSITNLGKGGAEGGNQFHKWEVKPLKPKA